MYDKIKKWFLKNKVIKKKSIDLNAVLVTTRTFNTTSTFERDILNSTFPATNNPFTTKGACTPKWSSRSHAKNVNAHTTKMEECLGL